MGTLGCGMSAVPKLCMMGTAALPKVLIVVLLGWLAASLGQEEGLYAPAPPANAAFVRLVYAAPTAPAMEVSLGEVRYGSLAYGEGTPYRIVLQGEYQLSSELLKQNLQLIAGNFYTGVIAPTPTGLEVTLFQDKPVTNRAKAIITLYNVSALSTAELMTADGATSVLSAVAAGESASVEVNPVTVDLVVFANQHAIAEAASFSLEPGRTYSVFVMGDEAAPKVAVLKGETIAE